jgi:hypothetical protein
MMSRYHVPISVYSDIELDIGYDNADTRYRDIPDIGYPDIGTFPDIGIPDIGYVPISGIPISGPISGYTDIGTKISRYRVNRKFDI